MSIIEFVLRRLSLRKKINDYYKHNDADNEIRDILSYVGKGLYKTFSYKFTKKYTKRKNTVLYDDRCKLNYVVHNGKKMYFAKNMGKKEVNRYYNQLCMEQDEQSPHNYSRFVNKKKYDTVIDLGAAEGIFSLDIIDRANKVLIFECDEIWIDALKETFRPWDDKVTIIKSFVGNGIEDESVKLDDIIDSNDKIDLVKMDIEGNEYDALLGMTNTMDSNNELELLLCTYHNQDDEKKITELLKDWSFIHSNGYMLFFEDKNQKPPYFRRGLIYGVRK